MAQADNRILRDYALPQGSAITSSVVGPEANNFDLNPVFISFMKRERFGGHPLENPNAHLRKFLVKCDTIKLNGVSTHAIRLRPLPFSLKDRASD